MFFIGIVLHFY